MKPAMISRTPIAVTQPQPRIPKALRSNELTKREMPENSSQKVNRNGSESIVLSLIHISEPTRPY